MMPATHSLLPALLLAAALASCSRHVQVLEVSGEDVDAQTGRIASAGDGFEVYYNLWGPNGESEVLIHNTSDEGLYIDWTRSSLIVGNQSHPYYRNEQTLDASFAASTVDAHEWWSVTEGTVSGVISGTEPTTYLPPRSACRRRATAPLLETPLAMAGATVSKERRPRVSEVPYKVWSREYDAVSSPVTFRHYLMVSRDKSFASEEVVDAAFYVAGARQFAAPFFHVVDRDANGHPVPGPNGTTSTYPDQAANRFYVEVGL